MDLMPLIKGLDIDRADREPLVQECPYKVSSNETTAAGDEHINFSILHSYPFKANVRGRHDHNVSQNMTVFGFRGEEPVPRCFE